ncbi:hypothetical protein [Chamaesiphon polymorphus]|uniref:Uncharacterized protein n=1 Tax=Chamaesiphon polymorphus CCALA 037 TaxID=2107692 RepID=A0A2T1FZ39_9CYAN|nr:hypothetical protein [Chamaesiphon polymorphus]PSB50257.1 hypothetical protein C7B77_22995 [Chamaesiphon polymorphus CCALA 037]
MIYHISTAVNNPLHVSQVFAEILQGQSIPFPEHPGSYIALALDTHGTMIEFHPLGTTLIPGKIVNEAANHQPDPAALIYTANHTAISVPISIDRLNSIATREGWQMLYCRRGENYFDVIEFWVENQLLFELLPPEIVDKYLAFMSPESLVAAAQAAAAQPLIAA